MVDLILIPLPWFYFILGLMGGGVVLFGASVMRDRSSAPGSLTPMRVVGFSGLWCAGLSTVVFLYAVVAFVSAHQDVNIFDLLM